MGRPKQLLVVEPAEREQLERWARRPKSEQRLALRSRIVLRCAEGLDNDEVAEQFGRLSRKDCSVGVGRIGAPWCGSIVEGVWYFVYGLAAAACRQSLSRLWVAQTSFHSARQAARPRRKKRSQRRLTLIWPKTGSASWRRFA